MKISLTQKFVRYLLFISDLTSCIMLRYKIGNPLLNFTIKDEIFQAFNGLS